MAKPPKLRMTNADYVAIAVSPALIMALVGSLVFFLIEVLYVGQYQARLMYVFALFVFATVLIGRISIEEGAERAALFALPLGIAMFLVLAKFVPHANPYSHLINIGLLTVVWWSAHKLTWDCTLIDDSEDASGAGLMQQMGVDELLEEPGSTDNELLPDGDEKQKKTPHTPGLWVLYFSLAALPLFGIGQKWIPATDTGRRQYAFGLLAVYVAAGLTLLVTTSFLGLRRYLRQRRVEMPAPMAATWVVTGAVLIVVVLLLAALIPRPQAEYAISQMPWQTNSPTDLAASKTSIGDDGTEDESEGVSKVLSQETDPNATARREGDEPTTTSDEAEQQASGESSDGNESSPSEQAEQGEQEGSSQTQSKSDQRQSDSSGTESQTDTKFQESNQQDEEQVNEQSSENGETNNSRNSENADSESAADSSRPRVSPPDLLPEIGGLTGVVKLILYAIIGLVVVFAVWRKRREIAQAIRELVQQLREFWRRLFGAGDVKPASEEDDEVVGVKGTPLRAFATYADPFASGQSRSMQPDEVVRYTFEAFEAWARERGTPRSPDQTPLELVRRAVPQDSPLRAEALQLVRLYNEAAYAPGVVTGSAVEKLAQLWALLRQAPASSRVVENSA